MQMPHVAIFIAATLLQAQDTRDVPRPSDGTSRISGVVVTDEARPRPLRRARVTVSGPDLRPARSVITDDQGRFFFERLPAGRFSLSATKETYVTTGFGATRPGRPGTSVAVAPSQEVSGITIRLPRGAVVIGTVVDHNGQPVGNVPVRVMRWGFMSGQRTLLPSQSDQTDDLGAYRIHGVAPGEYLVMASVPEQSVATELRLTSDVDVSRALRETAAGGAASIRAQEREALAQRTVTYAPVYYPSAIQPADGALVVLRAGEERTGVDMQLQLVPTVRVEGTITLRDGQPPPFTLVSLVTGGQQAYASMFAGSGMKTARTNTEGRFTFTSVPAGQYTLTARATARPASGGAPAAGAESTSALWASMPLSVQADVSNLALQLAEGSEISGRLRFEAAPGTAHPSPRSARVMLLPVQGEGEVALGVPPASIDADGTFRVEGVVPGRYLLSTTMPGVQVQKWMLRSEMGAGREFADRPFEVGVQNIAGLELTLTDRVSRISGFVEDAAGQPTPDCYVVVFPVEPSLRFAQSRRVTGARPAHDAKYTAVLPPGEYFLTAVVDAEPDEWRDAAFLERLAARAIRFSLAEGEEKVQNLRLGGS